jgi:hypothetical protein
MSNPQLTVFDPFSQRDDLTEQQLLAQEVVFYGESRFRSILITYNQSSREKQSWMTGMIDQELVCQISYNQIIPKSRSK